MTNGSTASPAGSRRILVAGDVCLDVVGVPVPPPSAQTSNAPENWRLTGETRTHFLPGGAMLLAEFIRAPRLKEPLSEAEKTARQEIEQQKIEGDAADEHLHKKLDEVRRRESPAVEDEIMGPRPRPNKPKVLVDKELKPGPLYTQDFLSIAARLTRDEIVHSLLTVDLYDTSDDPKKEERKTLRVKNCHGYSGPAQKAPSLLISYPSEEASAQIIVLDDTGNQFRKKRAAGSNPWPTVIKQAAPASGQKPLIIYKLHSPLPNAGPNALWQKVATNHNRNRLVIVSIDDLRKAGAPISLGLSWERTALHVVWHLLNWSSFSELKTCTHLVIRIGLDGAILWQGDDDRTKCRAWLIYDPQSIEGMFQLKLKGDMIAYSDAFTAALVMEVTAFDEAVISILVGSDSDPVDLAANALCSAIKKGLLASRRTLQFGFGNVPSHPHYPGAELFNAPDKKEAIFASAKIPIIPYSGEPDRSGWRLLNQILENRELQLRAVELVATERKAPKKTDDEPRDAEEYRTAETLLKKVPIATFGKLRTYDRHEIEQYRSIHTLLRDYLSSDAPPRPLSIAVFGPPGAGKSFGVREVAASLEGQRDCKEVKPLVFNLSLYQEPDELAAAFHLVRNESLKGKVPLVFFDEFDCVLDKPLAWLRYFLSPMQDGEFLDRGAPHPIGPAVFVFAGGTFSTFKEFEDHPNIKEEEFKAAKGRDFLSRLRGKLDIPSLNYLVAQGSLRAHTGTSQPLDSFDPYGPAEALPCDAAVRFRRATILASNLKKKAPSLARADGSLKIDIQVLRRLLSLPRFKHGNRSFEALLEMSHLAGAENFTASLLPAPFQISLHTYYEFFSLPPDYAYELEERNRIAQEIHKHYIEQRKERDEYNPEKPSHQKWKNLSEKYRNSSALQADDIPAKLSALGLWFRKPAPASPPITPQTARPLPLTKDELEEAARWEHDRWVTVERREGYIYGPKYDTTLRTHPCILPWDDPELTEVEKNKDRDAIRAIPRYLAAAGYEVFKQ